MCLEFLEVLCLLSTRRTEKYKYCPASDLYLCGFRRPGMKRVLLGSVGMLAISASLMSAALGADLSRRAPVPYQVPVYAPAFSWTGFYLGGSVGGRWGNID